MPFGATIFIKFNYMEKKESKGLGDSIEKFTKATGIKTIVDAVNDLRGIKKDCGCNKRKEILNRKFPYKNMKELNQNK